MQSLSKTLESLWHWGSQPDSASVRTEPLLYWRPQQCLSLCCWSQVWALLLRRTVGTLTEFRTASCDFVRHRQLVKPQTARRDVFLCPLGALLTCTFSTRKETLHSGWDHVNMPRWIRRLDRMKRTLRGTSSASMERRWKTAGHTSQESQRGEWWGWVHHLLLIQPKISAQG